jgi:hypothetical protein
MFRIMAIVEELPDAPTPWVAPYICVWVRWVPGHCSITGWVAVGTDKMAFISMTYIVYWMLLPWLLLWPGLCGAFVVCPM